MTLRTILMAAILACTMPTAAQNVTYQKADSALVEELLRDSRLHGPLDYARKLLGRPYVAHTLEVNSDERLVVNLRQLDCTTLVETVAALTLCNRQGRHNFADYTRMLQQLRYRQGRLNGYTSRLHYFSDWIDDKQAMGMVSEIQQPVPPFSAVQTLKINFMSTHPKSYRALTARPELVKEIALQEQKLTGRNYRYIPKAMVSNQALLRKAVKDGDIIAITCNKPGLDIAHLGFAVWQKDGLHLLNASQIHKKVVLEPMTLAEYLKKHPSHTGIRIIRILT